MFKNMFTNQKNGFNPLQSLKNQFIIKNYIDKKIYTIYVLYIKICITIEFKTFPNVHISILSA